MRKQDGTPPSLRAVDDVLAKHEADPEWRGEDSVAGGRPQELSLSEERKLIALVFRERGRAVVTSRYCQKMLPFLRRLQEQTVRNYLQRAGLSWLRRRRKSAVPSEWKTKRMAHCDWILSRREPTLRRWAYTDGTTFYLARGPAENLGKQRAALGPCVWRMSNGKDGLWDENIGPSLYAKSQGQPVKIWGLFADGRLEYYLLPEDGAQRTTNMNAETYQWLVGRHFADWRKRCFGDDGPAYLVQDGERCLWKAESLAALRGAGFAVIDHPKYSPDLNAIENWWNRLRQRLDETSPAECESRPSFVRRLRRTATWMNDNIRGEGRHLCTNQKERACAIKLLEGAKCKW